MGIIISTVLCIIVLHFVNISGGKGDKCLPRKPLVHLFLLGFAAAIVIVIGAVIMDGRAEAFTTSALGISNTNILYLIIDNFLYTALIEEGLKYAAIRIYTGKHDIFRCPHHFITAAAAAAAGFTAAENIVYLFADAALLLRIIFGISGHFVYAVFMGYDISKAAEADDPSEKKKLYRRAFIIPFVMHGVYDLSCSLLQLDFNAFLYLLVLLVLVIVYIRFYIIAAIKKVKETSRNDAPTIPDTAENGAASGQ